MQAKNLKAGDTFITDAYFVGLVNHIDIENEKLTGWFIWSKRMPLEWQKSSVSMIDYCREVKKYELTPEQVILLPEDARNFYTPPLISTVSSTQTSECTCKNLWVGIDNNCPYHNRNK